MSPRFAKYLLLAASAAYVNGQTKILVSNDDGWAVANVRAFFNSLGEQGYNLVMSAPAENKSGTGSSDATPTPLDSSGCEFSSCPGNSPAIGSNSTDHTTTGTKTHASTAARFNYVNSFPATSVEFGVQSIAPPLFGGTSPDLVVAGPNVGSNLGSTVLISGTVGAACEAVKLGIPAIAFSGSSGSQVSYTTLSSSSSSTTAALVYASLSTTVTKTLLAAPFNASAPILPQGIALNVNFPSTTGNCKSASAFKFVLTRINSAASGAAADVETCGRTRLPTESSTVSTSGCISSISVMNATTKGDVDATTQALVLNKLGSLLTCP